MAQTFRKGKIEDLHHKFQLTRDHLKAQIGDYKDDPILCYWFKGQIDAYEFVLKGIEYDFDLTAE